MSLRKSRHRFSRALPDQQMGQMSAVGFHKIRPCDLPMVFSYADTVSSRSVARIAQLVEHKTVNLAVAGSSPAPAMAFLKGHQPETLFATQWVWGLVRERFGAPVLKQPSGDRGTRANHRSPCQAVRSGRDDDAVLELNEEVFERLHIRPMYRKIRSGATQCAACNRSPALWLGSVWRGKSNVE